ncbi:MAG: hypothetical protein M3Q06_13675 [Bacteroidota bacterium]|nr:hypothetical protein [Bacteroidota bacterium]
MKLKVFFLLFLGVTAIAKAQVPVLYYDFEKNTTRAAMENTVEQAINNGNSPMTRTTLAGASIFQVAGAGGLYGGASGSGVRSWSWPMGNDPGTGAKEFYQFTTNTSGFSGLTLAFDAARQGVLSPTKLGVLWSVDGTTFLPATTAPQTIPGNYTTLSFVLPAAADNRTALTIRIYAFGGMDLLSGFDLDNLTLLASTLAGVKTLFDFDNLGLSMASGTVYIPTYNSLTITDAGTLVTLNSKLNLSGTFSVVNSSTFYLGNNAKVSSGSSISVGDGSVIQVTATSQNGALKEHFNDQSLSLHANAAIEFVGTLPQRQNAGSLTNIIINNASGVTMTGNVVLNGSLTLKTGTLTVNTNQLTVKGNIRKTAGFIDAGNAELIFNGTTSQTVDAGTFSGSVGTLTVNNSAGVLTSADAVITGALNLTAGTYSIGNTIHTVTGNITRTTGIMDASAGTLIFNGAAEQIIPAGSIFGTIRNLSVNNASGLSINDDYTILSNLNLQAGTLNLSGKTLTLGGTVSGAGMFKGSSLSALSIASNTVVGTLNFDQRTDGSSNSLASLRVLSGTVNLGSKLHLYKYMNVAGGTLDLAGKNLVLKSTAAETAYVAEIIGTLNGETNVTVERHNPAASSRRYRLVTSPVANTSINTAWQEGNRWDGTVAPSATGYGTLITGQAQGTAATANGNGFDFWSAVAGASASVRYYASGASYNQATWQPVSSTLTPNAFDKNEAYLLFIRGDRSLSAGTAAGTTTLRATGKLKKGSFTVDVPGTKSHTLIGNPYASPLDFKAVYDANNTKIKPYFWIWQAALGTGTGGYVLVQPVAAGSNLYEAIPGNGTKSAANRLIHSGEGFFVIPATSSAANTITIQEGQKSTGAPGVSVFREGEKEAAKLYVNLFTDIDGKETLLDGVLSQYHTSQAEKGTVNIAKATNASENLAIQKNGNDMIVASYATPKRGDTLHLHIWNTTVRDYRLQLNVAGLDSLGLSAVLVDKYLGIETYLSQQGDATNYQFSVSTNAASKNTSRFCILFRPQRASKFPSLVTSYIRAKQKQGGIGVQWQMEPENDASRYVVEKSSDGKSFQTLATVGATASIRQQQYENFDPTPFDTTYYRIKTMTITGKARYSNLVKVALHESESRFAIYPNPVSEGLLRLQFINKAAGCYTYTLYNSMGQPILAKPLLHAGGTAIYNVRISNELPNGQYMLEVKKESEKQLVKLQVVN